jgi:hypothetical protein
VKMEYRTMRVLRPNFARFSAQPTDLEDFCPRGQSCNVTKNP